MTNALSRVVAVAATLAAFSSASAATIEVHSVAELTATVTSASAGDTIRLMKDGSPYVFTDSSVGMGNGGYQSKTPYLLIISKNLVIEGEDDSSRTTWTDLSEPVVMDGNNVGGFAHVNSGKTLTLRNLTFIRGTCFANYTAPIYSAKSAIADSNADVVCSNCVFRQNSGSNYSGAFCAAILDCLVTNNTACSLRACYAVGCDIVGNPGGATSLSKAYDCRFVANTGFLGSEGTVMSNCIVRANTRASGSLVTGGGTFTDCTFEDNVADGGSLLESNQAAGTQPLSCARCKFRRNAMFPSVVRNAAAIEHCLFEENIGYDGCAVRFDKTGLSARVDTCAFTNNAVRAGNADRSGGAIYMGRTDTYNCEALVTNCTFTGNASGTSLPGKGGAIYNNDTSSTAEECPWKFFKAVDCTFTTNIATQAAGVYGVHAVRCTFDRNFRRHLDYGWHFGNAAWKSYLEECDINDGDIYSCVADRCTIHDVPDTVAGIFREYARVTNCIVERCVLDPNSALYMAPYTALDAEFVNCTIVSNNFYTYSVNTNYTPNGLSFINCLFNGNRNKYYITDFDVYKAATAYPDQLEYVTFSNTYYGKVDTLIATRGTMDFAKFSAKTNAPNSLMCCEDPKFVGLDAKTSGLHPAAPYWSLSLKSPLLGKGDPLGFTDADLDLAGRPRIRDGKVDPGCYQCWLTPPGLMMIIR